VSVLSRILAGAGREGRSGLENPTSAFLDAIGGAPTYSGKSVTVESSLQLVPVFAAVSRIAGSIGSLPLVVYRRLEQGRERATNHRTWRLLHDQPNSNMAADEVWELVATHLLLWGNAYLAKLRDGNGNVSELIPLRPNRVEPIADGGVRYFILDGKKEERHTDADVLHIRGLGTDGLVGLSPITQARQMLGSGMALEEFTSRFWANSANPGGVLKHPRNLSKEAQERLKASWRRQTGGVANAGEIAILEEDMSWEQVGMPARDAQFIETAQFSLSQIEMLFGLPPGTLGGTTGDSMTYSNTESKGIDFVRWTLRRWLVRIEGALLRDVSLFVQGDRFYPEFLVEGLLRADTKTRYEAYKTALNGERWLSVNEVRERENLNPIQQEPDAAPDEQGEGTSDGNGNGD